MSVNMVTVFTVCIMVSLVLAIMIPFLSSKLALRCIGGKIIVIFFLLLSVRALLPIEFDFSIVVLCRNVIPFIRDFLLFSLELFGVQITVWGIWLAVWLIVAVLMFIKKIFEYCHIKKIIKYLAPVNNKSILNIWSLICCEHKSLKNVQLVETKAAISPFVIGVVRPTIVLPTYSFTQNESIYILKHEAMHCLYKDTVVKLLVDTLCIFYWWNPLFYILKKKLFEIIEIVNDKRILKNTTFNVKIEYLKCLSSTVEKISEMKADFILSFTKSNYRDLKKRVDLICEEKKDRNIVKGFLIAVLFCALALPVSIRLEPYSVPSGDDSYILLDSDDTYIIQQDKNVYDVYHKGKKLETVDDITYYPGIKVYDKR